MIDKNGRLFGFVSIVDLCILAAAAVIVIGLLYRQTAPHLQHFIAPNQDFYVVIQTNRLREYNVPVISVGDIMFRQHDSRPFGEIVEVLSQRAVEPMVRTDGTVVLAPAEGRYDISFVLRVQGSITDAGYFVNGNDHIGPGSAIIMVSNRVHLPFVNVAYISTDRPVLQ